MVFRPSFYPIWFYWKPSKQAFFLHVVDDMGEEAVARNNNKKNIKTINLMQIIVVQICEQMGSKLKFFLLLNRNGDARTQMDIHLLRETLDISG